MTEIHEGIINFNLDCDSDTSDYNTGHYLSPEVVNKLGLKAGDRVQYKIKDDEINILAKVHIKKTIEKID